jgi:hypothetical protein
MNGTPIEFSRLAKSQESSPPSVGLPNLPSILPLSLLVDKTKPKEDFRDPNRAPSGIAQPTPAFRWWWKRCGAGLYD